MKLTIINAALYTKKRKNLQCGGCGKWHKTTDVTEAIGGIWQFDPSRRIYYCACCVEYINTVLIGWDDWIDELYIGFLKRDPNYYQFRKSFKNRKGMSEQEIIKIAKTSPALERQINQSGRNGYPANYRGRVPLKVKVAKDVRPDLPFMAVKPGTMCEKDKEYYVRVNSYGAVTAILPNGEQLGLIPSEFDVTEWH